MPPTRDRIPEDSSSRIKGLVAKRIAKDYSELSPAEIGRTVGTGASYVKVALKAQRLGRDRVKSRAL